MPLPILRHALVAVGDAAALHGVTAPQPAASERRSLRVIYDAHFPFVWRNLRRLGVQPERLEDATQEVFLIVHRRWDRFSRLDSERTWLFGVTLRVAQNERRSVRRRKARTGLAAEESFWDGVPSPAAGPAEQVAEREAIRLIERALEALSDGERALFVLVELESQTVLEASRLLGINQQTAYGRLRAGRANLQRQLAKLRGRDHAQERDV